MKVNRRHIVVLPATMLASIASVYAWHVVTLCFTKFLTTAVSPVNGYSITYTDILGFRSGAYDPYMQEPENYRAFIQTRGAGSCLGIGHVRDAATGINQWLGFSLLSRSFILFAIFVGVWSIPRRIWKRLDARTESISPVSTRALWASTALLPVVMILLWYGSYPRMRLGQGVFEMHGHLWWAVLASGAALGLLASLVDWRIDAKLRRAAAACPRCRFPQPNPAVAQCPECGFISTQASVGAMMLRRSAKWLITISAVGIVAAALWIAWSPKHSVPGVGKAVRNWLLLRPLES